MTAACREACCNVTPRLSVGDLFERGFRRMREAPLSIEGEVCADAEDNQARFFLDLRNGKVAALGFRASPCATLIAYCELICETTTGLSADMAGAFAPRQLIDTLDGVPALKHGRASLAMAAFHSALVAASSSQTVLKGEAR
jgi:NifU-like protein involved in Fe-S cluster formation